RFLPRWGSGWELSPAEQQPCLDGPHKYTRNRVLYLGVPMPWRWVSGRGSNIQGLFSFRPLSDFKLDFLPFLEGFEARHLNGRKMGEEIFAAIVGSNKAKSFGVVEPFDSTH